ncbi:uncharacterized protein FA14DRAFT_154423 [Meira miltonrushii]|uniref:Uncharacterized protein n=1 Tax=Meira miltonrushii TaxID=1280837 RepID=A0A316VCG1_9BASI|nr:uncharacterized protein FA14DRAFT_154423 [Meira miltonrushii]PWN34994.1 hypothetical protein FA14DRAFT_154423 [Meira miltonrushii]
MKTARRKSTPHRSPSATVYPVNTNGSSSSSQVKVEDKQPFELHDRAPATFGTPALQSLIYATSNDRYPGAPGTLLHKAKLEAARALASKQREAQREAERREEMKRLGILGMGKKRSTANGNGSTNGNSRFGTPPTSDRTRRSNPASGNTTNGNGHTASVTNGTSTRPGRGNGRNVSSAIDHNALPTPASQPDAKQQNGVSSPLLSSSGRLRRPASGSRGTSPMPLTGSSTNGSGMVTRTRSPIVAPLELDDDAKVGSGALGLSSSSANGVLA